MKTMPIPQKISISEVRIYPKAHPRNSAKDPGFTGLLSPAGQSLVSLDFVQSLCSMMYLLPPCTTHLLFSHCPPIYSVFCSCSTTCIFYFYCVISCLLGHFIYCLLCIMLFSGFYLMKFFSSFTTQLTSFFSEAFID